MTFNEFYKFCKWTIMSLFRVFKDFFRFGAKPEKSSKMELDRRNHYSAPLPEGKPYGPEEIVENLIKQEVYEIYVSSNRNWFLKLNILSMTATDLFSLEEIPQDINHVFAYNSEMGKYLELTNKCDSEHLSFDRIAAFLFEDKYPETLKEFKGLPDFGF